MTLFELPEESDMIALGRSWSCAFKPGSVIFLSGNLGAGKTTLVRAILRELGHNGPVKSPTYTLVESYSINATTIYHFDLYRIKSVDELEMIGTRDMLGGDSICFIEWPDRGEGFLPVPDFSINIRHSNRVTGGRVIELIENAAYSITG